MDSVGSVQKAKQMSVHKETGPFALFQLQHQLAVTVEEGAAKTFVMFTDKTHGKAFEDSKGSELQQPLAS